MNWTTACPDWERRIVARESLIPNPPLFPDVADAALRVFKQLVLVDVLGQPTMGEACREWVFDFVRSIFGAYDEEAGRRLIVEFFLLISKKNTKSTTASGIMLTALLLNWRHSAEFFVIAPTIEVANNSFNPARDMIAHDEELSEMLHVQSHLRTITLRETGAVLKVVAADNETVSGKKATGILIDEFWLFGKRPNAENMLREATGGLASRPEGFIIYLTTQSDEAPAGVFHQKLEYARGVRDGKIDDPGFLPVLYEFPQSMIKSGAHRDPKNFYVTNPNLGLSVDETYLLRKRREAEIAGEASMCGFLAKHLNVEIKTLLRTQRWAAADFWDSRATVMTLDDMLTRCEVLEIGIDGGGLDDLLGLVVLGREAETLRWLIWAKAWCHPIALERRKENIEVYRDFQRTGDLTIVEEIGQDMEELGDIIEQCENSGLLDRIGVDQSGIGGVIDEIELRGIDTTTRVVGISQGWRMNGAIKTAERKLAEGVMWHCNQRMMAWCVSNARMEPKGNALVITKQVSGLGKIDPVLALINAVTLMAMNPEARGGPSIYETHEIIAI